MKVGEKTMQSIATILVRPASTMAKDAENNYRRSLEITAISSLVIFLQASLIFPSKILIFIKASLFI